MYLSKRYARRAAVLRAPRQVPRRRARWVWRCHLDTTEALPEVWSFLKGYVQGFDALVYTMKDYIKEQVRGPFIQIIPPAIDPLETLIEV